MQDLNRKMWRQMNSRHDCDADDEDDDQKEGLKRRKNLDQTSLRDQMRLQMQKKSWVQKRLQGDWSLMYLTLQ